MGKPTGFLENTRELPRKQPVAERLKHSREFVKKYGDEALNQQSGRCMDCGVPFCHSGCPLGNVIPEFNDAVYRGRWREAYEILSATNNFPEFTGRICPAPCESACVLGINQPPVAIEEIERHIIELAFERGFVEPRRIFNRTGKKVAVIGSGPAGLAAAAQLNSAGHTVTVFERDEAPGGLLRFGIPDFKLEKWVIDRRLKIMEEEGIAFKCRANVGENLPVNDLLSSFDALVLAVGSTVPRNLDVPGRDLEGVHFAMDFLTEQNRKIAAQGPTVGKFTSESGAEWQIKLPTNGQEKGAAFGKNVVVIGGGDTGSDCVGTANRQGAASVTQFELLPTPPENRSAAMPWPSFPMVLKTTSSHEEGCERKWATATKAFLGDESGRLRALKIVGLEWETGGGFVEIAGSEREIPCDLAFLAMGFLNPQKEGLLEKLDIELDGRGNVRASEHGFQTNIPKIFAAGDARRGQSLVVWAISEGRECARRVDEFLMGFSMLESKDGVAAMGAF